jgi:outer membrane protein assembly factor BamB
MRVVVALSCLLTLGSRSLADEAAVLLEKAGVRGGLCLVVGAKDPALAHGLASGSALYVQVLQPDAKRALAWGAAVAVSTNREDIGIRQAAFRVADYGLRLFNLIVVEDAGELGGTAPADLAAILVPNGWLAVRDAPAALAQAAARLGMISMAAGPYTLFRQPDRPVEWKLPLELKWAAGPRSQIASGFKGVSAGDGKLFYLARMERDTGDLNNSAARLFARDACNGRTLWTWELPGGYVRSDRIDLAVTSRGRVFVKASNGQAFCLEGATGEMLFALTDKANAFARLSVLSDDYIALGGEVRSTETGKIVWKIPTLRYQPLPGTAIGPHIYFCDGASIFAKELATGKDVWKVSTNTLPRAAAVKALSRAEKNLLVRMAGGKDEAAYALLDSADGKLLWSYTMPVPINARERYFSSANVRAATIDGKLLLYFRHDQAGVYRDEIVATKLDLATGRPDFENKVNKDAGDFHGCFGELQLGDYIAWFDLWVNKRTLETAKPGGPHPACFFGTSTAYGMVFDFPSRKSGPITATGPADPLPESLLAAPRLQKMGSVAAGGAAAAAPEWPMFRGQAAGGNATMAAIGTDLTMQWDVQVGMPGRDFGIMNSERTGLSQAVLGHGLAIVADIDGQRMVALDASSGAQKWVFHVGSRVDFPPTLYKGLCLFGARDGWVYALDALTGEPVYKLLAAPRERYMGTREKLESRWPLSSAVSIANGVAHVSGGGGGDLAFKPESGETLAARNPGRELRLAYDMLLKGNSIPRTNEDNKHGFTRNRFGRNLDARVLAFDDTLTVAYQFLPAGEGWANKGNLLLKGIAADPKKPVWTSEPIELVVDDIVLTPQFAYCVGHYQRIKKAPELWVVSREDGKVLNTVAVDGFPAFFGMSAAGNRLFVATREGKLICYEGK